MKNSFALCTTLFSIVEEQSALFSWWGRHFRQILHPGFWSWIIWSSSRMIWRRDYPCYHPSIQEKTQTNKAPTRFFFGTGFLKDYKTVIFSGDCISAVRNTAKGTKKIYYCHTPPRYIFDRKDDYLKRFLGFFAPSFWVLLLFSSGHTFEILHKWTSLSPIPPIHKRGSRSLLDMTLLLYIHQLIQSISKAILQSPKTLSQLLQTREYQACWYDSQSFSVTSWKDSRIYPWKQRSRQGKGA